MHDFVPQLCVLNNEPGARRQQQLRIHAYLFGGLAVRQAGVFYRVSSGSRNPRCQNLDMLIHITASLAPQPAQQASLCLAAQPAKLAARNSHQNHIRTAMDNMIARLPILDRHVLKLVLGTAAWTEDAPYQFAVGFEPSAEARDDLIAWCREEHIPLLLQ